MRIIAQTEWIYLSPLVLIDLVLTQHTEITNTFLTQIRLNRRHNLVCGIDYRIMLGFITYAQSNTD